MTRFRLTKSHCAATAVLALLLLAGCGDKQEIPLLATVNGEEIRADAFRERLTNLWVKVDADNFKIRKDLLETMIEEKLLLQEAHAKGFTQTPEYLHKARTIAIDVVLDAFREAVAETLAAAQTTPEEVQRFMQLMNEKVSARHLFARTLEEAEALRRRLLQGETFEKLAEEVFEDPKLATSGGSLGWFGWEDMELAWSRAAQELEIGEISRPVRVRGGYSIIRVDARKKLPLLSDTEHLKQLDKAEWILQHRKRAQAIIDYDREQLRGLALKFEDDNLDKLLDRLLAQPQQDRPADDADAAVLPIDDLPDGMVLARSKRGVLTLAEFRKMARMTSARQRAKVHDRRSLEKFISGLILREHLLDQARQAGIDEREDVRHRIRLKKEKYLITRMMQTILDTVRVEEDTLRAYFEKHRDEFVFPRLVRVSEITVRTREQAETLLDRIRAGESFSALARAHSIRKRTARRGGDAGFRMREEFGAFGAEIFALEPGQVAGPFAMDGFFTLFQVTEIRPERAKTFAEAKQEIEKTLLPVKRGEVLQAFFDQRRETATITTDLRALARVVTPAERSFQYKQSDGE